MVVDDEGEVTARAAAKGGERCCCCELEAGPETTPVGPVERERWVRYWFGGERGEW